MGKKYIFGNWKMNLNIHEASIFAEKLLQDVKGHDDVESAIFPGFLALQPLSLQLHRERSHIKLGAQNFYWRDEGAFTGEVSATQLRGLAKYALVGHSERRHIFQESDREVRFKVQAALRNGIVPVLCVGETEMERNIGDTAHVINDQVTGGLLNVGSDNVDQVIIAYEPVWAIGGNEIPDPEDIVSAVKLIRRQVELMFGPKIAEKILVLYGGGANMSNAQVLLSTGINGLLVGSASLIAPEFSGMVEIAHKISEEEAKSDE